MSKEIKVANFINHFISTTKWNRSYNESNKKLFHSRGKKVLKEISKTLNMDCDIRSCLGGIAVSGEIILHSDKLYIQFGEEAIMYRSCKGRNDYSGGVNNWMPYESLRNLDKACMAFQSII